MLTVHSYAVNDQLLMRIRSICDAHLRLRVEEVGEKLVKALEVCKIRGAAKVTGNIVNFDIEPHIGIRIIPITRAKA
jgi:flagellar protein FlaH